MTTVDDFKHITTTYVAVDLKTYGPLYAQLRLVVIKGPLARCKIRVEWHRQEPSDEVRALIDAPAVTEFERGVLTVGEEILLCPPGDTPAGMDLPELIEQYAGVTVTVESNMGPLSASIDDLAGYWKMLQDANIVDAEDQILAARRDAKRLTDRLTTAVDNLGLDVRAMSASLSTSARMRHARQRRLKAFWNKTKRRITAKLRRK